MQRGGPAGGPRVSLGIHLDSCRVLCRLTPRFATLGPGLDRAKAKGEASVDILIVLLSFGLFNQAQGGGASLLGDLRAGQHARDFLSPLGRAEPRDAGRDSLARANIAFGDPIVVLRPRG